jgi:UDP-2,3-diacylglucosamine pyrophosphatase LpxH
MGIAEAKMTSFSRSRPTRVRTLFLSDLHLGFKRSRAAELADFLLTIDADTIVLAGDIIDGLSMSQRFFWSAEHSRVLQVLLAKRRAGARLVYIPGNHDAALAPFVALLHGQLEVHREWVHSTARGERFLVLHGDQFDGAACVAGWLHRLGEAVYDLTIVLNDHLNDLRRLSRRSYWPLAARLKLMAQTSVRYIERFEDTAVAHAVSRGFDGIICGHIHRPNLKRAGDVTYCNIGDWVESCSALIEDAEGELHLWRLGDTPVVSLQILPPLLADAA